MNPRESFSFGLRKPIPVLDRSERFPSRKEPAISALGQVTLLSIFIAGGAAVYGAIANRNVKQQAIMRALVARTVILDQFRALFNSANFILGQASRPENVALRNCIRPNDNGSGSSAANCQGMSLAPTVLGLPVTLRIAGGTTRISGGSEATAVTYGLSGKRVALDGTPCGNTPTNKCPWLAWTTFKPVCPANPTGVCDQARSIEFQVFVVSAQAGGGVPIRIPGLETQPLPRDPLLFAVDVAAFFEAHAVSCPPGHKQLGRDKRGAPICDRACGPGWQPTGAWMQWTAGTPGGNDNAPEQYVSMPVCTLVDPVCPPRSVYRGVDAWGTPICFQECANSGITDGLQVGTNGQCVNLDNSNHACGPGEVMKGLNSNGTPHCVTESNNCVDMPTSLQCPTGYFLKKTNATDCSIVCEEKCPSKGPCKTECNPICSVPGGNRCCKLVD